MFSFLFHIGATKITYCRRK